MKLSDLSPAEQRQVRAGRADVPRRVVPPRPGPRRGARFRTLPSHRCGRCKAEFIGYARAERHMDDEHGGGRVEVIL